MSASTRSFRGLTRGRLRRSSVLAVCSVATLSLLAACGGSSSGSAGSGKDKLILNDPKAQLAAANKEGVVDWYTALSGDDVDPLIKAFNKAYPKIKVKSIRLSSSDLTPRVLAEQQAGKYNADFFYDSAIETSHMIAAGAIQNYTPTDQSPLPAGLTIPKGVSGVAAADTVVFAYNPELLKKNHVAVPTSWEDFTKPEWKGHFSINPGSPDVYDCLNQQMGHDAALALIKKIGANSPKLVTSHSQAAQDVQAGTTWGSVSVWGHDALEAQKAAGADGAKTIQFTNLQPLPVVLYLATMAKNAPHPNAAATFINWLTSDKGQQAMVPATGHESILGSKANDDASVWPDSATKLYCRPIISNDSFNSELKELQQALHVPS